MARYEYLVVRGGAHWEVRTRDRATPWAIFPEAEPAMDYAREAARQKAELDGIETGVKRLTVPVVGARTHASSGARGVA